MVGKPVTLVMRTDVILDSFAVVVNQQILNIFVLTKSRKPLQAAYYA